MTGQRVECKHLEDCEEGAGFDARAVALPGGPVVRMCYCCWTAVAGQVVQALLEQAASSAARANPLLFKTSRDELAERLGGR